MEGTQYQLSVIVPAHNAAATLGEQLRVLTGQGWARAWEIIVVNNQSTDETVAIARRIGASFPSLRIVDALARTGAAYAMNVGVRAARSAAVAFCDADDVVADGWVAAMGEGLRQYHFVSGPLETQRLNRSWVIKNRPNAQASGVQSYTYPPFLQHAGSGNMGLRREVYDVVGGFDESLETLFDTDFCWKAQLRGVRLVALPDAVVHVRHRDRVHALLRQARKYAEYDVALYKRYRPLGMPRLSRKSGISAWIDLAVHVLDVMHDETRARYLWDLGWRTGRLYGSIRYRTWAL